MIALPQAVLLVIIEGMWVRACTHPQWAGPSKDLCAFCVLYGGATVRTSVNKTGQECSLKHPGFRGKTADNVRFIEDFEVVPKEGLEPPRCCQRQILSLVRLPVPPLRRSFVYSYHFAP